MKTIRDYIKSWSERRKTTQKVEIINRFYLEERYGIMFIMCGQTAVEQMAFDTTVSDVLTRLQRHRNVALKHAGL